MRPNGLPPPCFRLLAGLCALACTPPPGTKPPQASPQTQVAEVEATAVEDASASDSNDNATEQQQDVPVETPLLELATTRASLIEGPLEDACGDGEYAPSDEAALVLPNALPATYRRVAPLTCESPPFSTQRLLIATSAGTFQSEFVLYFSMAVSGAQTGGTTVHEITLKQIVRGGPPELVVRVQGNLSSGGSSPDYYETQTEELYLCGLSKDGVPACSEPLRVSLNHQGDDGNRTYALDVEFPEEGGVLLSSGSAALDDEAQSLIGYYQLMLP